MKNLLYKELRLALHPACILFLFLSAMMLIPSYPLSITFFYSCLGIFFVCLTGRENKDIPYTVLLPVRKRDMVRARFSLAMILQLSQLVLCVPFLFLRQLYPPQGNPVGMDANIALLGLGFILFGIFNLSFLGSYYRHPDKVGIPFVLSAVWVFLFIGLEETFTHIVPLVRDRLDTPDPQFLVEKCALLVTGILLYGLLTFLSYRSSVKSFEQLDLAV